MDDLRGMAARLVWWQPAEETLRDPQRFLGQVMALGTWQDVRTVWRVFGEATLQAALRHAAPGVFDERSWQFWHLVFGLTPVAPRPQRTFS